MKLIGIETSTNVCSVALNNEGDITVQQVQVAQSHAKHALPLTEALLQSKQLTLKDIDAIAYGRGPGSFTGVRVACAVAQGMAYACKIPVIGISSLAAMAQNVDANDVFAVLDARMGQVYCAEFRRGKNGLVECFGSERIDSPERLVHAMNDPFVGVGSGWLAFEKILVPQMGGGLTRIDRDGYPKADGVVKLAQAVWENNACQPPSDAQPVYLRNKVAQKPKRLQP